MKKLSTLIVAFIATLTTAFSAQIAYTVNVPMANTDWTNTVSLQQFNPSLGQLYRVVINVGFTNHRQAGFWSFATNSVTYEIAYTCTTRLLWPDATECGSEVHTEWAAGTLGISGGTYTANLTNVGFFNKESCKDFPPSKVGPYSWLGTGTIPFKLTMTGEIQLGVMDFTQIFPFLITEGGASVTVTYSYTPGFTGTSWPCH